LAKFQLPPDYKAGVQYSRFDIGLWPNFRRV
jgi:hypothetical protein